MAQAIAQGLKRAGITVTIRPLDSEPLTDPRNAFLHGSKVQNFYLPPYPPYPNVLIVGLSK